jgi:hypothetical protein
LTDKVNEDSGSDHATVVDGSIAIQPSISVSLLLGKRRRAPAR